MNKKNIIVLIAIGLFPIAAFAQNSGSSGNKAAGNSTKASNNAAGNATTPSADSSTQTTPVGEENFNGTGTTTYNNGTGANTFGNGTGTTNTVNANKQNNNKMSPGKTTRLTLDGLKGTDATQIIQSAKNAGATDARIEGNTLVITGNNFKTDRFKSLLTASQPSVDVQ